jgi:ABC-type antimicrobial peptide transport system permease subunit
MQTNGIETIPGFFLIGAPLMEFRREIFMSRPALMSIISHTELPILVPNVAPHVSNKVTGRYRYLTDLPRCLTPKQYYATYILILIAVLKV